MSTSTIDLAASLKAWRGCTPDRPRGTITQREAAERLGIPYDTLREIERSGTFRYPLLLINAMNCQAATFRNEQPAREGHM